MYSMRKSSNKHIGPQIDNFREYSVELGLRTHRPSGFTHSFLPAAGNTSEAVKYSATHTDGSLSTCSNTPQCGELGDWWDLPSSSSAANYEQRTKTVRVSYSLDEIYGKAKVPLTEGIIKQSKQERVDKVPEQITSTLPSSELQESAPTNAKKETLPKYDKSLTNKTPKYANLRDRLHNHKLNDFDNASILPVNATNDSRDHSSNGYSYSSVYDDVQHPHKHQPRNAWDVNNNYDRDLSGINFRTFEEAMRMYPSDDEDSSEEANNSKHYQHLKPHLNNVQYHTSDAMRQDIQVMVKPNIPPPSYESSVLNKDDNDLTNSAVMIDSMSAISKVKQDDLGRVLHNYRLPSSEEPISADVPIQKQADPAGLKQLDDNIDDRNKQSSKGDNLPNLLKDVELDDQVTEDVPSLDLQSSNTTSAILRQANRINRLTSLEEENICDFVSSPRDRPVQAAVVPPIDLGQLSPKKSKTLPSTQKPARRPASAPLKSKSVNLQTSPTKKSQPSTYKLLNPVSKSMSSQKTTQIAREIKMRVQKNPTEIAKEIKRRVQSQPGASADFKSSKGSFKSKPDTQDTCYLKLDRVPSAKTPTEKPENPTEIAKEIKRIVQSQPRANTDIKSSKESVNYAKSKPGAQENGYLKLDRVPLDEASAEKPLKMDTDYLKLDKMSKSQYSTDQRQPSAKSSSDYLNLNTQSHTLSSRSNSILDSFRGYDKLHIMSPRIESGEVSVWQCLPDEVWLIVLSFLPVSDLHSFMMCCHDFNRLAHDRSLWRSVSLYKKVLADSEVLKIGYLKPYSLSIVNCEGVKMNGDSVSNQGLKELFTSCGASLDKLSVASCITPRFSGETMLHHAAVHCPNITSLDLSWCNVIDHAVELVCNSFLGLKEIFLNGNQGVTDASLVPLLQTLNHQFETIEVQGCFKLTNKFLVEVGKCNSIQSLNISQCRKFSGRGIEDSITKLSKLQSLTMKCLNVIQSSNITRIVKSCRNIRQLNLSRCTNLTSTSLVEIGCGLACLKHLDVSSCKNCVTDNSLSSLLANCRGLISLDLSSCPITNASLAYISVSCGDLSDLKLNFCSVTDSGVKELVTSCLSLRQLQLYGIKGIQTEELSELNSKIVLKN